MELLNIQTYIYIAIVIKFIRNLMEEEDEVKIKKAEIFYRFRRRRLSKSGGKCLRECSSTGAISRAGKKTVNRAVVARFKIDNIVGISGWQARIKEISV